MAIEKMSFSARCKLSKVLMLVTTLLSIWCLSASPIMCADAWRSAEPKDINLSLTLLTKAGTITADEPLLARIELLNQSEDKLEFVSGNDQSPTACVEIRDENGILVASTPKPDLSNGIYATIRLAAGESRSMVWIISGLYKFDKPGVYTVSVKQLKVTGEKDEVMPVIAEDSAKIKVLPFDAAQLETRCEEIFEPLRTHSAHKTDLSMSVRTKALYSVHNDIVLPYLEWLARESHSMYACNAILRVGTEKAKSIVNTLVTQQDDLGIAACKAQEFSAQPRNVSWDMGIGQ